LYLQLTALLNEPVILFVVAGTDTWSHDIVAKADRVATKLAAIRRVVWIRGTAVCEDIIRELLVQSLFGDNIMEDPSYAFTLSFNDKVCWTRSSADPEPDFLEIMEAYLLAEKG